MLRHFRQQSMLLWFGNTILLIALFLLLPASSLVWFSSKNISVTDFQLAVFLWSLLSLLRSLRSARTIELQVLDQFALLAKITLWPALLSVTLVFLGVLFWPAVWTILAVILSELWMAMLLNRAVSRFTS
jgi:O-antigen/teichoic acid export membrane protein